MNMKKSIRKRNQVFGANHTVELIDENCVVETFFDEARTSWCLSSLPEAVEGGRRTMTQMIGARRC